MTSIKMARTMASLIAMLNNISKEMMMVRRKYAMMMKLAMLKIMMK
jgi:hypothetical protein